MNYEEIEKRQYDARQMILTNDGKVILNPLKCAVKDEIIDQDKKVLCPFCLNIDPIFKFNIKKGLRVCPRCGTLMRLETLTKLTDMDKFAKFIFDYRFSGFWDKICLDVIQKDRTTRFNEWNKRLYKIGLSTSFWEKYKSFKGFGGE